MRSARRLAVAAALLAPLPSLRAQTPAARAALGAYRDSLTAITEATTLAPVLAAATRAARADGADPVGQARLGVTLLRQAAFDSSRAVLDAAGAAFDEAAYRAPRTPYPWYGLALVKVELSRRGAVPKAAMHQALGEYYDRAALVALSRSIDADPTFAPAASTLAELLLGAGELELEPAVRQAVRTAVAAHAGADPYLALGRMYRGLDNRDSALVAFRAYLGAGGDPGLGRLEEARAYRDLDRPDSAVAEYLAGAEQAGAVGRAAYRGDLGWVAGVHELDALDSLPAADFGTWVADFWARRDAKALRAHGEVISEHLRRWLYIHRSFRLVGRREGAQFSDDPGAGAELTAPELTGPDNPDFAFFTPGLYNALDEGGKRVVDDRGVVYIRQGEPDHRVAAHSSDSGSAGKHGCFGANESWQYALPTGALVLHFCGSRRLGLTAPTTLVSMLPLESAMLSARGDFDGRYQQMAFALDALADRARLNKAGGMPTGVASAISPELVRIVERDTRHDMAVGLHTDSYVQRFDRSLQPIVQLYAAGTPAPDNARLLAVFALPGERLVPQVRAGLSGVVYPVSIRTIAVGPDGLDVLRRDTTRYFRAADTLRAGAYLTGLLELPLPAGSHDVRLLFTQPGSTAAAAAGRDAMTIGTPGRLAVSDIISGSTGGGLVWNHDGERVLLNPLDVYSRTATMELYYELSGLVPGRSYRTTLALTGRTGAAGDGVQAAFTETAGAVVQQLRRALALKTLKGGSYRLVLTIEDTLTGATVRRERRVNVR